MISEIQIEIIIKFGTAKSMNTYSKSKIPNLKKKIFNLKYVFIDFSAPNQILKHIFSWDYSEGGESTSLCRLETAAISISVFVSTLTIAAIATERYGCKAV